jgi:hypothetical protein
MDAIYAPSFAAQLNELLTVSPDGKVYNKIAGMVETADYKTMPQGLLRVDGRFFLVLNLGAMIFIPWERAQKQDFFAFYSAALQDDITDILAEAKLLASQWNAKGISANLLVTVTASRRGGQRTRGINIWGP